MLTQINRRKATRQYERVFMRHAIDSQYRMVRDKRCPADPLAHVAKINAAVEGGLERRALSPDEFAALVSATRTGQPFRDLKGSDRAALYLTAAYTGLRAG